MAISPPPQIERMDETINHITGCSMINGYYTMISRLCIGGVFLYILHYKNAQRDKIILMFNLLKNVSLKNKAPSGFTIVELIVVVVVIAILSSVTVLSYNGVTNRADTSQVSALVQEWSTTLNMYKSTTGSYPKGNLDYVCLGKPGEFSANGVFAENQCYKSSWSVATDESILADIKASTGGLPGGLYHKERTIGNESYRGLLYLSRNNGFGITYILPRTADGCLADDTFFEQGNFIVCRRILEGDPYSGL